MIYQFAPLLLALLIGLEPGPGPVPDTVPHDFHVTYSRLAVEGNTAAVRIRLFKDDLGMALTQREEQEVIMDISPRSDSLFQAYFRELFVMRAGDELLTGRLVGSGEEVIGKEPMWWYLVEFQAEEPIETLHLSQRILSEVFGDQKNIVQIQHFPSDKTYSLYCAEDAWEYELSFPEE